MSLKHQILSLSKYNSWANSKIIDYLAVLSEEEIKANRNMYFRSLNGTLQHMILADELWWSRITGNASKYGEFSHLWGLKSKDERTQWENQISYKDLFSELNRVSARWPIFINGLDDMCIEESFTYHDTRGQGTKIGITQSLLHIFNHGTHHRGQISTILNLLDKDCDMLDYTYSPFIGKENVSN